MALSGLVWNYSHTCWCGCDQAEERKTHGGLKGERKAPNQTSSRHTQDLICLCVGGSTSHHGRSAADPLTLFNRQLTSRRGE